MSLLLDNAPLRRLVTITGVVLALVLVTALLPALLLAGLIFDLVRRLTKGTPLMAVRILLFSWVYLLGETWGLAVLAITATLPHRRAVAATYRLQESWAAWNFRAVRFIFGLHFTVSGQDQLDPGPIILVSRHASLIDTLLPSWFVARARDFKLRYVLKKELLLDPALDIAGNRLPNHFVDREAGDSEPDLESIRDLGSDLGADEGVLIYPEGTRYSDEKRDRYTRRFLTKSGRVASIGAGLRSVLPPRPGGTLALLEGSSADIVVLMHKGLEGFAHVKDMWKGGIVDSEISVLFRRIARSDIPVERSDRVIWLFEVWREIDDWVTGDKPVAGTT